MADQRLPITLAAVIPPMPEKPATALLDQLELAAVQGRALRHAESANKVNVNTLVQIVRQFWKALAAKLGGTIHGAHAVFDRKMSFKLESHGVITSAEAATLDDLALFWEKLPLILERHATICNEQAQAHNDNNRRVSALLARFLAMSVLLNTDHARLSTHVVDDLMDDPRFVDALLAAYASGDDGVEKFLRQQLAKDIGHLAAK